jgi:hypothetical protein
MVLIVGHRCKKWRVLLSLLTITASAIAQTNVSLRQRIPKADPSKYQQVRDGKDWKNPYLVVRRDGVEIIGFTSAEPAIPLESIAAELERLPASAWPYGLVVAVQDISLGSAADWPLVHSNRAKLLEILKKLGIKAELWPSGQMA